MLKSKPPDAEVEARCRSRRVLLVESFAVKAQRKKPAAKAPRKIAKKLSVDMFDGILSMLRKLV